MSGEKVSVCYNLCIKETRFKGVGLVAELFHVLVRRSRMNGLLFIFGCLFIGLGINFLRGKI